MSSSRYSEMEMQQWHDAAQTAAESQDAPRSQRAHAMMAKGQADTKPSRTDSATSQTPQSKQEPWASECLFDWYNS